MVREMVVLVTQSTLALTPLASHRFQGCFSPLKFLLWEMMSRMHRSFLVISPQSQRGGVFVPAGLQRAPTHGWGIPVLPEEP